MVDIWGDHRYPLQNVFTYTDTMSAATGSLKQQAVLAAKQGEWQKAIDFNQAIIEKEPTDVGAFNRLGVSLLQVQQVVEAKKAFKAALSLDRFNTIAKKNLEKLNQNDSVNQTLTFSKQQFIEEPGKTKVIELHRLAGKQVLDMVSVGSKCQFVCKKRYISVEAAGVYVGALPEDISFRLSKLIQNGNEYECYIRSATTSTCSVYVREIIRSEANQDTSSFPINRNSRFATDDLDEGLLKEDVGLEYSSFETEEIEEPEETPRNSQDFE